MTLIKDLLELKDRNLYLDIDGKKMPMSMQYYVADNIFFFEVDEKAKLSTIDDLRTILEMEAEDNCWREDIYIAPMENISSCEIRFPKDFSKVTENDIFDDYYVITHIDTTYDDVIIYLK